MSDKNSGIFSLRRYPYEYGITFVSFLVIIFLPLWLYEMFIVNCVDPFDSPWQSYELAGYICPIADWESIYIVVIFLLMVIAIFTGHFVKPWGPFLTISEDELRYNRIPFFLHFTFLDKYLWKTFSMQQIASIKLVIRAQDADKTGFKLSGNQEDINNYVRNLTDDEYLRWLGNRGFSKNYPYYKNQKLALLDKNNTTIAELNVSFAYEEDLQKLHAFLDKKGTSFSILFRNMTDETKDLYT